MRLDFGRRVGKVLLLLFCLVFFCLVLTGMWLFVHLNGSLPITEGEFNLEGLLAPVIVERDELGVPTVRAESRLDASRGLGFIHAQERFFQMDLVRRRAAGELAELVGAGALGLDRRQRLHRFRARAEGVVASLSVDDRRLLNAYVEGVNAGLAALDAPPFEYLLLRLEPAPWRAADTLLAVYAMYADLQSSGALRERTLGLLHDTLAPELFEFLAPRGTEWDTPMAGGPFKAPPIPPADLVDLRGRPPEAEAEAGAVQARLDDSKVEPRGLFSPLEAVAAGLVGSNNWAVAGSHSAHGGALLANDMHLGHGVPNIWFRASLVFPDDAGEERRVTGVTLPGAMLVVAGSNGHVAWGFTNSQGDWSDLVVLEPDPTDEDAYLSPEGPRSFVHHREVLRVKGGEDETLEILETIWGPVWDTDHQGRRRAWRWVAHDPRAVNLDLRRLESVNTLEEAIAIAHQAGLPAQNFTVADRSGRVGWTLMGPMPRRFGHDGRLPTSWADGSRGWDGWLEPEEVPRVIDPVEGRVWTANNRIVSGGDYALIGDGGYNLGARARQIRDGLFALEKAREVDLLAIQLDDRALFLERWQKLLLDVLDKEALAADGRRVELRRLLSTWDGHASVDSVSYRLVRVFRVTIIRSALRWLTASTAAVDERFDIRWLPLVEGPVWQLVSERPPHLLSPRFKDWQEALLAAVDEMVDHLLKDGPLADRTWGEMNTVRVNHPLSLAVPALGRWLNMPPTALPGDTHMPRVQGRSHGASERFVVSPGREEEGFFHMPTGQSGHPLSPHYGDGHGAWVEGGATAFLPGEPVEILRLVPPAE
jgi:penicillin amidase